ncbi:Zinc finger, AN1-type [Corchorus olitorius]|uniref:Zinc finger, AN1-type n=1 Tax=Corchorus olitorius TaxID=93759 RepID=A0A1R3JSW2_9ROSI|nr:Zinc finger, AN1-type [Corchorus olitorius]
MDSEESMVPKLCLKGCGFHGSPQTDNLCSQCCKDFLKAELQNRRNPVDQNPLISATNDEPPKFCFTFNDPFRVNNIDTSCFSFGSTNSNNSGAAVLTNTKNRCDTCNKRVGLTGFDCPCGNLFCGKHRYPEEHGCCVDFKSIGREALVKDNPVCKGDKLQFRI